MLLRCKKILNPSLAVLSLGFCLTAHALDFRTVLPSKAILYDAPSAEASRVYILSQGYPVEVIVNLGEWVKVRDQQGGLNWIESKNLVNKRTVLVTADKTEMKIAEDSNSALVATVEKDVVLELLATTNKNGWIKVKHRDGVTGFVQASDVWGF